jgi:hypothetical protein
MSESQLADQYVRDLERGSREKDAKIHDLEDANQQLRGAHTGVIEDKQELQTAVNEALAVLKQYGSTDGAHHKQWVLDQMVRHLMGAGYDQWVIDFADGPDGPESYEWDLGIPP